MTVISKLDVSASSQPHTQRASAHASKDRASGTHGPINYNRMDFHRRSQMLDSMMNVIENVLKDDPGLHLKDALDNLSNTMNDQLTKVAQAGLKGEENPDAEAIKTELRELSTLFTDYTAKRHPEVANTETPSERSETEQSDMALHPAHLALADVEARIMTLIEDAGEFKTVIDVQKGVDTLNALKNKFDTMSTGDGVRTFFDGNARQKAIADSVIGGQPYFNHQVLSDEDAVAIAQNLAQSLKTAKLNLSHASEERHLRDMA